MSNTECADKVISGYRLPKPVKCPQEVYNIMMKCWSTNPNERPTFSNILDNLKVIIGTENRVKSSFQSNKNTEFYQLNGEREDNYMNK